MSKQKHRSFRRVLNIERFVKTEGKLTYPVTLITWAIVERENSKSIHTRHLGVTAYVGSTKHQGVAAWVSSGKTFAISKKAPCESKEYKDLAFRRISEAYWHALYSFLGSDTIERTGKVRWFASDGHGTLEDAETGLTFHFFACNFTGADSHYPEHVTNVSLKTGDTLRFKIHSDPFMSRHLGATSLRVAA